MDISLDTIDVYIWSCRGTYGECSKAAANPSAVNAFGHRIKNNRRSSSKKFKKSKRTKKSRRKTRKYRRR